MIHTLTKDQAWGMHACFVNIRRSSLIPTAFLYKTLATRSAKGYIVHIPAGSSLLHGKDAIPFEDAPLAHPRFRSTLFTCAWLGVTLVLLGSVISTGYATSNALVRGSDANIQASTSMTNTSVITPAPNINVTKQQQALAANDLARSEPTYRGRALQVKTTRWMTVTAYCPRACCCGKSDGITASGQHVSRHDMKLVAGPPDMRFGTIVSVPGYHHQTPVPVLDRGGKIKGDRLDLLMPTHAQAKKWGVKRLKVTIWEFAE